MPDLSDWNEDGSKAESLLRKQSSKNKAHLATVDWEDVLAEEKEYLDFLNDSRVTDGAIGGSGGKFALAFSGGGLRAAAFQSGVLWQLAKRNRLKDVTYFIAVSGGGYVASSFASHCAGRPAPESGGVKAWYLAVVADTICRMQENAGNFVRDAVANPGRSDKASSPDKGCFPWPRFMDLPLLLGALFMTLALHPTMYVTIFLIPVTIVIDMFFGPGMRAAFCYSGENAIQEVPWIIWELTPINWFFYAVGYSIGASLLFSILSGACCRPPKKHPISLVRDKPTFGFYFGHALTSFFVRISVILIMLTAVIGLSVLAEIASYKHQHEREGHCARYISEQNARPVQEESCVDFFRAGVVLNESAITDQMGNNQHLDMAHQSFWSIPGETQTSANSTEVRPSAEELGRIWGIFGILGVALLVISASLCIFLPCLGAGNIITFAAYTGPVIVLASTVSVIQYAVYGPLTGNIHGAMGPYDEAKWKSMVGWCLMLNLPVLVVYEELRSTLHHYYKHCLQKNFFMNGSDVRIAELAKDFYHSQKEEVPAYNCYKYGAEDSKLSGASYCPLMMVTATSSDYQCPGDADTISEVSISPLHTGGEETHYVRTTRSLSLAKCTAITGAGCLDAITLSMTSTLYLRFWLEALNLSWGDYLLHNTQKSRVMDFAEKMFDKIPAGWEWEDVLVRLVHRFWGGLIWVIAFVLVLHGWWDMQGVSFHHIFGTWYSNTCEEAALYFRVATILVLFMVATAFLSFLPLFDVMSLSSVSRLFLQLTKYMHVGEYPPKLLYCTDGGVQDCTGLDQLMRRQVDRIFLVLAGADPTDELTILHNAIDVAARERIGSFYDPKNPKRDFKVMLEEYKEELAEGTPKKGSIMHIKICYGYRDELGKPLGKKQPKYGDLFIIKNRLPSDAPTTILPPITADEINLGKAGDAAVEWAAAKKMTTASLGGLCCCDCCHKCCNVGGKFPHGTFTGYLYLSPLWFSSLSRLGFHLADQGMAKMDSTGAFDP